MLPTSRPNKRLSVVLALNSAAETFTSKRSTSLSPIVSSRDLFLEGERERGGRDEGRKRENGQRKGEMEEERERGGRDEGRKRENGQRKGEREGAWEREGKLKGGGKRH